MIEVVEGDPRHPDATRLLKSSHALMEASFPSGSNHYLSIDDLVADNITFLHGKIDGQILGTGAIKHCSTYGEIKSMFTDPSARGQGLADAILGRLCQTAEIRGVEIVRLETGNSLHAAHRLYRRHGFVDRGPFGDYPDDPLSMFMEKRL